MKIAIHSSQFDGRGTGKVPYDYGIALQKIGHEVIFITSNLSANESIAKFREKFQVFTYEKHISKHLGHEIQYDIDKILYKERVDFIHMIKAGENDKIVPTTCKSGIHCVFNMTENHGNVYAGVSEYLAKKFNQTLYVPHIIKNVEPTIDVRKEMGISEDTLIVGRIGGADSFDLQFVKESIINVLNIRKDIIFIFLSTNPFYSHERLLNIPWVETEEEKFNVIHACDVMIHGRRMGETFGIACGEFSAANKPVITWSGANNLHYDTCHLELLGDKAIKYNYSYDLTNILSELERKGIKDKNWDVYSKRFNEDSVINQYQNVFLK